MKRTATVLLSVGMVAALLLIGLESASSQAPVPSRTLTFFDPNATDFEKELNVGPKRFSSGDSALVKDRFLEPETCEVAGIFLGRFTFVKRAGERDGFFLLDAGALLPDGKVTFYWPGRFSEFERTSEGAGAAVTGGTGAYEGAGGSVTVEEDVQMCDKRGSLVTVHLTP